MKLLLRQLFFLVTAISLGGCQSSTRNSGSLNPANNQQLESEIATKCAEIKATNKQIAELQQKRQVQSELIRKNDQTIIHIKQQELKVVQLEKEHMVMVAELSKLEKQTAAARQNVMQKKNELDTRRLELDGMRKSQKNAPDSLVVIDEKIKELNARLTKLTNEKRVQENKLLSKNQHVKNSEKPFKDTNATNARTHTTNSSASTQVIQERTILETPLVAPDSEIKR